MSPSLRKPKIYLAGPLFSPLERQFNLSLAHKLDERFDVFLPQRDGSLLTNLVSKGLSVEKCQEAIFNTDCVALDNTDILIAILDGRTVDEGTAFELGYARAKNKYCIGLKTDDRFMLPTGDNPMIVKGCHHITNTVDQLVMFISIMVDEFNLSSSDYFANWALNSDHRMEITEID